MKIKEILKFLTDSKTAYRFDGDSECNVDGFCQLSNPSSFKITWAKSFVDEETIDRLDKTNLLVISSSANCFANKCNYLFVEKPKNTFFAILNHFFSDSTTIGISNNSTVLSQNIGKNVSIGPNCFVDKNVVIGDDVVISSNVVLVNNVKIGNRVSIQSMSAIGEDGFGYYEDDVGAKTMIKHHGGVVIEDDVFISSHVNIARGTMGDTVIHSGTKIAPNTHIGHNCVIGRNVTIICSEIFGSVTIDDNSYISKSVIKNQLKIGKDVIVGMGSVVLKDVPDNVVVVGVPAKFLRNNKEE